MGFRKKNYYSAFSIFLNGSTHIFPAGCGYCYYIGPYSAGLGCVENRCYSIRINCFLLSFGDKLCDGDDDGSCVTHTSRSNYRCWTVGNIVFLTFILWDDIRVEEVCHLTTCPCFFYKRSLSLGAQHALCFAPPHFAVSRFLLAWAHALFFSLLLLISFIGRPAQEKENIKTATWV